MTPLEFEQALDRWGADLERWPQERIGPAGACLTEHASARRSLEAAQRVDRYLAGLADPARAAPAHLAARIVASTPRRDGLQRGLDWLTGRVWRPAVLALFVVAGGYLAGAAVQEPLDTDLADEVMSLAFSDIYAEVDNGQ
ncbi:MAG: hypothetical protein RIC56_00570 [Pseudomonadales bacterium]